MRREGVYVMRVASRLSGMHPQTLRKYERFGLLAPTRIGALRMYSDADIALLKMIKYLIGNLGLNLGRSGIGNGDEIGLESAATAG